MSNVLSLMYVPFIPVAVWEINSGLASACQQLDNSWADGGHPLSFWLFGEEGEGLRGVGGGWGGHYLAALTGRFFCITVLIGLRSLTRPALTVFLLVPSSSSCFYFLCLYFCSSGLVDNLCRFLPEKSRAKKSTISMLFSRPNP